jgi:L,D-transpeptidase-like protein/putative peptidoglycan binding protein
VRAALVLVAFFAFAPTAPASGFTLELRAPAVATYGDQVTLRGRVIPALVDAPVTILRDGSPFATASTGLDGAFSLRTRADGPATYAAQAGELAAAPVAVAIRPRLTARLVGSGVVGRPLRLEARVQPAGPVRIRMGARTRTVAGSGRIAIPTGHVGTFRIRVTAVPPEGWLPAGRVLRAAVVQPNLAFGSRGPSVRALEQRLRELHYALPSVDGYYGLETAQAVLAFQKVSGLTRSGRVDVRIWQRLSRAHPPRARYGGTHVEVSKGRQVLFVVRDGQVSLVVHVSTGATGNTPLGTFRVYRKVVGWDWVLWYPMYFVGGFAIHGYPSVPAYPASHGCVRVPMWVAPRLFATNPWGRTVYVYW